MMRKRSEPRDELMPAHGVFVFESHHASDFHMDWRRHTFVKVLVVLDGSGRVWIGQTSHRCTVGDVLIVPAGRDNRIEDDASSPLSLYVLCMQPELWAMEPGLTRKLATGPIAISDVTTDRIRRMMRRLLYLQTTEKAGARAHAVGLALQIIAELVDHPARGAAKLTDPRRLMQQYVDELGQRFYEVQRIEDEAARLGISRRAFTERFKQITGETWLSYIHTLRLNHARRLLAETDRTVSSIAFECGYGDLSNFYRMFSRGERLSPLDYRKKYRTAG